MKKGKTYRNKYNKTQVKCMLITPAGNSVVIYADREVFLSKKYFKDYEEYKEPRKGEYWVNIYETDLKLVHHKAFYRTKKEADNAVMKGYDRIACKKISWTEGDSE